MDSFIFTEAQDSFCLQINQEEKSNHEFKNLKISILSIKCTTLLECCDEKIISKNFRDMIRFKN